jgi:hypothetical protein
MFVTDLFVTDLFVTDLFVTDLFVVERFCVGAFVARNRGVKCGLTFVASWQRCTVIVRPGPNLKLLLVPT